jgi:L-threonylcarbamoyladenylate synthase
MSFSEEIDQCAAVIRDGGVVIYPTDTIWGLGCDATNQKAVDRLLAIKKRSSPKGLIILLDSDNRLMRYVRFVPEVAWDIIDNSDKPITVIYPEGYNLAPQVPADDGSVAIRITDDEFCRQLVRKLGKPLVSTSANVADSPAPEHFDDITSELLEQVDYVVNHRQNEKRKGQASSIIRLGIGGQVEIIRS